MASYKLSKYRAETPPITEVATGARHRVVYSTRSEAVRLLDETTWQRLKGGELEPIPGTILSDLIQSELLVPSDEDELKTILARNAAAAAANTTAYVVVQPTALCQFGCSYCGQSHRHRFISAEHQEKVVARVRNLLASGRYHKLLIGWFGGEPTLALDEMRSLTRCFRDLVAEFGCAFDAKIVSNGFLLGPELATEFVADLGISAIEITLDGMREDHDRSRPTKGGGPTFDRIVNNLLALARRDDIQVGLSVRCNVSRENRAGVLQLLELLASAGVQEKLSVYPAPIHDWGNSAQSEYGSPMKDYAVWEVEFLIRAIQLGFRPRLLPARKTINCMTFMPGSEMVDAYGNRFNCTEVSYVDAYETPFRPRRARPPELDGDRCPDAHQPLCHRPPRPRR